MLTVQDRYKFLPGGYYNFAKPLAYFQSRNYYHWHPHDRKQVFDMLAAQVSSIFLARCLYFDRLELLVTCYLPAIQLPQNQLIGLAVTHR